MSEPVLRPAQFADIPALALFRRLMFEDMNAAEQRERDFDPEELYVMEAVFAEYLRARLGDEVRAWVITVDGYVVACAAVSVLPTVPAPGRLDMRMVLLHNVHTLPEFRRRGFARRLVETAVAWCREEGFDRLSLNASAAGQPLYESMGFGLTKQMSLKLR
jgi:GNAT superfamily N-acetyltransferase